MLIRVETYPSAKGLPGPRRLYFSNRHIDVAEIRDRWDGPDYCYFKVLGSDENLYIVRYDEIHDRWDLTLFDTQQAPMVPEPPGKKRKYH